MNIPALDPGVVGALVTFLASDEAQEINGRDFIVGGNEIGLFTIPLVEARIFSAASGSRSTGLRAVPCDDRRGGKRGVQARHRDVRGERYG